MPLLNVSALDPCASNKPLIQRISSQQTNASGRDAFHESVWLGEGREEVAGWIEGFIVKTEGGDMEGTAEDEKKQEVNGNKVEEFEQRDEIAEEVKADKQDVDDVVERADKLEL